MYAHDQAGSPFDHPEQTPAAGAASALSQDRFDGYSDRGWRERDAGVADRQQAPLHHDDPQAASDPGFVLADEQRQRASPALQRKD